MDTDMDRETNVSVVVNVGDPEAELNGVDLFEGMSSNGEVVGDLGSASEVISRVELDIACYSEKLVNLDILMMYVATRENEFEAFASDREHILADSPEKALEFDFLSGILDSEVRELENFMNALEVDIINARELISSFRHLGRTSMKMEEKLLDSENSLKQSREQIFEIKKQSAQFHRTLSYLDEEGNWNGGKGTNFSKGNQVLNANAKIKMQTAEQQRHFLRMLEKSLAREMDLEKKFAESRQIDEELKLRLISLAREMEEEAINACERLFEAENIAEILKGTSKELLGQLQLVRFNMNGSIQRETELRSKLNSSMEQLEVKENALLKLESRNAKLNDLLLVQTGRSKEAEDKLSLANSENFTLREKVDSLEKQLKEGQHKVDSLDRQMRESDIQLQHAVASAEASQEKQIMLYSTIRDMENLIENLKLKVTKADNRADNAEDKLIVLSETNAGLTEKLRFLRDRLECVEASLHQVEETKLATAKDIAIQTKVITDLLMRLAIERERLHQQISSLTLENKAMAVKLQQTNKDPGILMHDSTIASVTESKEEVTELSAAISEPENTQKNESIDKIEVAPVDLTSEHGTVRTIAAGILNYKHVFRALFIVLVSAAAYFFIKQNSQF
ncbi:WPP domain-interacting tail-anchored protein 1-like isoform X1 [Mangifera indica]|uniref:WPP domain-interacting tail-anchored protein 1-like isoform X1 n=1 Tax=Mangifera indica TaxID=29780 RepID=UPI001CF983D4|nr:WPP domain-interacting tail-anchored protein 1-like isoform X1 [Mangifera indica]XP_044480991.1 WPP domain-interacting tail-anchored protein 1-like isoform X1 [Mangifera indica]